LSGKGPRICRKRQQWRQGSVARRWWTGGGRKPEDRLRASLARARGLSGVGGCGRAGREWGGSEAEDRLRVSLAKARSLSGVGGRGIAERDRSGSEAVGRLVVSWWRRPEVCPGRMRICVRRPFVLKDRLARFFWSGSVQPVGNTVQTDQVVNRLTRADNGEFIALDQDFGCQGTGVVGR